MLLVRCVTLKVQSFYSLFLRKQSGHIGILVQALRSQLTTLTPHVLTELHAARKTSAPSELTSLQVCIRLRSVFVLRDESHQSSSVRVSASRAQPRHAERAPSASQLIHFHITNPALTNL